MHYRRQKKQVEKTETDHKIMDVIERIKFRGGEMGLDFTVTVEQTEDEDGDDSQESEGEGEDESSERVKTASGENIEAQSGAENQSVYYFKNYLKYDKFF